MFDYFLKNEFHSISFKGGFSLEEILDHHPFVAILAISCKRKKKRQRFNWQEQRRTRPEGEPTLELEAVAVFDGAPRVTRPSLCPV